MRRVGSLLDAAGSASTWLLLGGLVLASTVVHTLTTAGMEAPQILCDEFIHGGIADSVARAGDYTYRDAPLRFSLTYPLALAPAWLAASMDTTYELIKGINALLMSSAAVPLFLWARRIVSVGWAFVAALLVVLMPAFALTGLIMTENAAFPAFVLAVYAIAVALERPTVAHQLLALGAIALAIATRYQHLVLLGVLVGAGVIKLLLDWRADVGRPALARQAKYSGLLIGVAGVIGIGYVVWKWARGQPLASGLGPYSDLTLAGYPLDEVLRWTALNGGELVLATGAIGACALVVLVGEGIAGRLQEPAERAFAAVALAGTVGVLLVVGVFAASIAGTVVERYSFYAVPLLLLALVAWLDRGLPRPRVATGVAVGVSVALVAGLLTIPRDVLFGGSLPVNTITTFALHRLSLRFSDGADAVIVLGAIGLLAAVAAFAFLPRRFARVALPLAVAAMLLAVSRPVLGATEGGSIPARTAAGPEPAWIDAQIGGDTEAPYLMQFDPDVWTASSVMLQTEFWNRAVDDLLIFGGAQICSTLPETSLTVDPVTGALEKGSAGERTAISPEYVVTRRGTNIAGAVVADGGPGELVPLSLYKVDPPLRINSTADGLFQDGWMSDRATYTQYVGDPGGIAQVTVGRAGWGGPDVPGNVKIRLGKLVRDPDGTVRLGKPIQTFDLVVHAGDQQTFNIAPPPPPFRVEVTVDPTFSPAQFGQGDTRQLGAQVSFLYVPKT